MMELSDYRRGLFQWDTGRSLIVTEKDITEVHFQLLPPPSGSTETTDADSCCAGFAERDWCTDFALFLCKEKETLATSLFLD